MAERRETYWALVESHAQIVGKGGRVLDVGVRDAQDSVLVDGVRYPIDPWGTITVIEPNLGDAVVTLMLAFDVEILEMEA